METRVLWVLFFGAFSGGPLLLTGCSLDVPDKGEPFVSERIVGAWAGSRYVDGLPQEGQAGLEVLLEDDLVDFSLYMAGGALLGEGEPPLG